MFVPNPIAFELFALEVRWYGIIIAVGMILGSLLLYKRAPKHRLDPEKMLDLIIVGIPLGVIGARLYYVVFNLPLYLNSNGNIDILKVLNIRTGGLAVHGGLILAFIGVALLCRHYKYHPIDVLDLAVPGVALAQAIGRWGNFFNSEAHGGPTDLPWGIFVDGQMVHPTFLYESLWCFALCIFLVYIDNRRKFVGQTFLLYTSLYSLERFFVEGLRTDSLMLGPLRQAQVLSVVVILVSLFIYYYLARGNRKIIEVDEMENRE